MFDNSVLVTGGRGMLGRAVQSVYPSATFLERKDCDLTNRKETKKVFEKIKPKYVIHLAAKVGGVKGNTDYIGDFYRENILINTNVIDAAAKFGTKKLVSVLSTCVYPDAKYIKYPLTENQLHLGPPHESNFGYAHAKRMIDVQSRAYYQQHGKNFICAIPNNIFGPHDQFDLENGHVVPALIRKVWEAKNNRDKEVVFWGDGSPLREFTYSRDIARGLLFLLWSVKEYQEVPINIGCTEEYTIKEIAEYIVEYFEYTGKVVWDTNMPAGQHRKPSCNKRFAELGFDTKNYTNIFEALGETCDWFQRNYPYVRGNKGEIK
jgi:GDP-L-fucose synthase